MVPKGWVEYSGSAITSKITKGSSPKWQGFEYQDHGTLFVTSENVRDGYLDVSSPKYLPVEFNQKLKNSQLQHGDILINIVGASIGRSCQFLLGTQQANINQAVCLFRTNELALSDYVKHFLQLPSTVRKLLGTQSESARPNLSLADMKDFIFVLPPLQEQKKIAKILSAWDKAIITTEQLLANGQQQKKALMQQLLTGKKRLLDKNGVRFSGEWKDIRLKSVLREVKTRNKDNSIDRVLSVTNHSGFVLPEDQFSKRVASDDVSNYKVVKKGEYGYNPSRLNVGSFARLDSYEEGLLSPMYVVFSVNEKILNSDYFMNWMSSNEAKQRISGSTQGSVRDSVGFDSLCGFPFKLPPMEEQQKIASVLSTADQEISALQQQLDTLKQEKKALMQQLLTGKRRVKIDNKEVV